MMMMLMEREKLVDKTILFLICLERGLNWIQGAKDGKDSMGETSKQTTL